MDHPIVVSMRAEIDEAVKVLRGRYLDDSDNGLVATWRNFRYERGRWPTEEEEAFRRRWFRWP